MRRYSRDEWSRVFDHMLGERLPGAAEQLYDQVSPVAQYVLGSRMAVDERVYHYARAGAALVALNTYRLAVNADLNSAATWDMQLAVAALATDRLVTVTHGNYGIPVATTVAANELVGGWIELWGAGNLHAWRRITGNTASAAGVPAFITITFDRPIGFAMAAAVAGITVALHRNIYYNTQAAGVAVGEESANGLAPVPVALGSFFWLQTWGPCFIAPQVANPGAVADDRDVYFGAAGTTATLAAAAAAWGNVSPQRIGYVMGSSTFGDGNSDIMLQLAP